jgi:hypothetical protein
MTNLPGVRHRLMAWLWLRFGLFPQASKRSQQVMSQWMAEQLASQSDDKRTTADG